MLRLERERELILYCKEPDQEAEAFWQEIKIFLFVHVFRTEEELDIGCIEFTLRHHPKEVQPILNKLLHHLLTSSTMTASISFFSFSALTNVSSPNKESICSRVLPCVSGKKKM